MNKKLMMLYCASLIQCHAMHLKHYLIPLGLFGIALGSIYTMHSMEKRSFSPLKNIRRFFSNNDVVEVRIKSNDQSVHSYSFEELKHYPLYSYFLPKEDQSHHEEYDIEIPFADHTSIKELIGIVNNIATTKSFKQRARIYNELEHTILNNSLSIIQALNYQAILNTLQLTINIDKKEDQYDLIMLLLVTKAHNSTIGLTATQRTMLTLIAQHHEALQPITWQLLAH